MTMASFSNDMDQVEISGMDLKALLYNRLARPLGTDPAFMVAAETAMRHYVDAWCVDVWNQWFAGRGATMALETEDKERGSQVSYIARYERIQTIIEQIARISNLWYDVVFEEGMRTYRFEVHEQINAGQNSPIPYRFSTSLENISRIVWDQREVTTDMYGLADGTGINRNVQHVTGTNINSLPFESRVDVRNTSGSAAEDQTQAMLDEEIEESLAVSVTLNERSIADYRNGWDLGYVVGIEAHRIGMYTERMIEEIQVTQQQGRAEDIQVRFGDPTRDPIEFMKAQERRMNQVIAI
jgi:hypothetical protein